MCVAYTHTHFCTWYTKELYLRSQLVLSEKIDRVCLVVAYAPTHTLNLLLSGEVSRFRGLNDSGFLRVPD
jgi:hypothetical protein